MYYPDELIEEVRARNDIVDVISGYVRIQKKGNNYFGLCPFHSEKSPSFSVSGEKQMYYCFGCGAGGNVISFIMQYENYSFKEALKLLAERAGVDLPDAEDSAEARQRDGLRGQILQLNKLAAQFYYYQLRSEGGKLGLSYLTDRGLSQKTMQAFGLGYASPRSSLYRHLKQKNVSDDILRQSGLVKADESRGMYDKFYNRVMFPIMDVNNRVIGFGGRVMGDGAPKYLNSPETAVFDKSRNLYGLNQARLARKKNIIICEGYMDVISLHQAGFNQAVASLGTAFTAGQANLLKRYTQEVLLTYDSDEAGVKAALRAIPILKDAGLTARVINMEPYKDPDEFIKNLGADAFEERIRQAEGSFFFEIRLLERQYDLKDPESKTKFCVEVVKKLLTFTEELERENYLEAVAERYHLGFENLRKMVVKYAAGGAAAAAYEKPRSGIHSKKEKDDGIKKTQRLLLTWLVDEPGAYAAVKKYIGPEDFTEELYRRVACMLYEQLEQGGHNAAAIISRFEDVGEQSEVAKLFNTTLQQLDSRQEREKALTDIVRQMKRYAMEHKEAAEGVPASLEALIARKKAVEALAKLHISLD